MCALSKIYLFNLDKIIIFGYSHKKQYYKRMSCILLHTCYIIIHILAFQIKYSLFLFCQKMSSIHKSLIIINNDKIINYQ